ncbi:MAG TPA: SRPBCC family protein [Opitutaceae bacterium]
MLTLILIAVVVIVMVLLVVVALQPSQYTVARSLHVAASPSAVFPHVNNLRNTVVWSPWVKYDPNAKQTFAGPDAGVGSINAWDGNKHIGAGRQTIVASHPDQRVVIKLEFFRPFAAVCETSYNLKPENHGTLVTWDIKGTNNFLAKAFSLVMSSEKMLGGPFEEGLANLKRVVETGR